jgi:uncharacterized damage-inducible protein DinB
MTGRSEKRTKRQKAFLKRLAEAKEHLAASIEGLDETALCQEPVAGDWTIKDILGHIVSWNEEFRANIAMILQDEHPGYDHAISRRDNFSGWNRHSIAEKRSYTFDQIMADLERDHQEATGLIEGLKAEEYRKRGVTPWKDAAVRRPEKLEKGDTDTVETLVTFHWRHMNEHIREIEVWRKKREIGER